MDDRQLTTKLELLRDMSPRRYEQVARIIVMALREHPPYLELLESYERGAISDTEYHARLDLLSLPALH